MKKQIYILFMAVLCAISLIGCGKDNKQSKNSMKKAESRTINLVVWGSKEDEALMKQIIESFQTKYKDQADFHITFAAQGESNCKDVLIAELEKGADVFTFADDQLNALAAAGALLPIENADKIKQEHLPRAVEAASVGDTLYAYPLTADNGYFLYYNKKYFTPKDVESLDNMMKIAKKNKKHITMDWSSAWYGYSFSGNTGLEIGLNEDGITNYCTWNKKDADVNGVDVAEAMLNIARHPGFTTRKDEDFLTGVENGSVIAGISGVWNSVAVTKIWGKNTGAAKLPTYTCDGRQIQMASFSGCKLIGVNAYSKNHKWASMLAEWITNEENQKLRFEIRGQGPSNKKTAASAEIQNSPAIAALLEQTEFSHLQRVGGKFWEPVASFAKNISKGNPKNENLQKQLDKMVEDVTAR